MTTLLLKNANVVLPDREAPGGSVLIEEGKIVSLDARQGGEEIDLAGATLLPGFIDFHIHGAAGIDVMDATANDLHEVSEYLASQGVTGWLPTFVPASDDNYASAIAAISEAMHGRGARVLGVHYEGPFVNTAQCGALHTEYFKTYSSPEDLNSLPLPATGVRMITLAPEVSGGVDLVRELKTRGWVISIGHTRADVKLLDAACEAGAHHMTHFMNAMAPLHHRNPGPIAWGLSRDEVTFDCIADGVHLDPFMLRLLLKVKGAERISLISDAIAAAGKGDGDYQIWGETIFVKNGRTANASGNIAGSVISMLDAVRMMHSLGVANVDIARMASLNPARLLGLDSICGSIEPGKRADLVALDGDNNPTLTVIDGKIVSHKGAK
ncbi:MAG TPA: N-acetylglucosamine-6-phosphate deacetylase [Pyrinomonadaceae bacterium]|jgi:N-acetylglucosamine-6-phosphate deacetylase|nr:N-acetylglucosamine-6-phosphate deacetylase [Pyrinomonadaceae bacterium]